MSPPWAGTVVWAVLVVPSGFVYGTEYRLCDPTWRVNVPPALSIARITSLAFTTVCLAARQYKRQVARHHRVSSDLTPIYVQSAAAAGEGYGGYYCAYGDDGGAYPDGGD